MNLRVFSGSDLGSALARVRAELGEEAMIVYTTRKLVEGRPVVEVVASSAGEVTPLRQRLERVTSVPSLPERAGEGTGRPHVVALVGPTGAGKTTTAAKLSLHPAAFGGRRVGFLGLDTYRIAAVEQLETYADIMGAPLEVAYEASEIEAAMDALSDCDVVIVDTPGRSPGDRSFVQWRAALRRAEPDEVHLCVPATIRPSVAMAHRNAYQDCGVSHLLVTKLDEMPDAAGVVELAEWVDLPVRWSTDGQAVPDNLLRGGGSLITNASRAAGEAKLRLVG